MSFDWKSIVKTVAPMLGTALGGPFGGIAGAAIAKALGTPDANPDTLSAAIQNATPDQLVAIKKIEDDFAAQMAQMGFADTEALEKIAADDRDSARKREIAVKDKTPAAGFYIITVGFFVLLVAMMFLPIPEANKAVLYVMVGSLGTAWVGCTNYYYGKSSTDPVKDHMLYNSTPTEAK